MAGRLHAPVELAIVKPLAPGLLEVSIASSNPATADHFYYLLAQNWPLTRNWKSTASFERKKTGPDKLMTRVN